MTTPHSDGERKPTKSEEGPEDAKSIVERQLVSSAHFLKAYHASTHSIDDYGLAPGHPALCVVGGKSKSRYSALA